VLSKTISAWLQRIGQPESFLNPKFKDLSNHELIEDRSIVIKTIADAIRSGTLIGIAHDYDSDGCCAATIMVDGIRSMGGRVEIFSSSRFGMGYGFSQPLAEKVLKSGVKLLVTCDFGSSDHERIQLLKDNGIPSLIIDHHLVPDRPLPSLGFLNPHKPTCPSTFKKMCSGGLAMSVIGGLKKHLGLTDFKVNQYLDLVAISTISDVMDLESDNRILVRHGLEAISRGDRPGIRALMEITNMKIGEPISGRDIGFRISPGINAPGRLGSVDIVVNVLLEKDINQARKLAAEIKEIWDRRRLITDEITQLCEEQVLMNGYVNNSAICVGSDSYGHGIVGISAARLVDKFKVPVCVIGHEGRGSLRGPPGSRLYDALVHCKEHLVKYGGHQAACGMQIKWENIHTFRQKFNEFFQLNPPVPPTDQFDPILEIDLSDRLMDVCRDLALLEPCGQGNPRPIIQTCGTVKHWKHVKGNHIKFDLELENGNTLPCFQIGNGEIQETKEGQKVTVRGDLRSNTWNGRTKAEMFINSVS